MSDLIVVTYPDEARAAAVMQELRRLRSQDLLDLEDAGYVTKSPNGRVMLYEAVPLGSKTSTVSRLLWGDLAGALMMIPYPEAALGDLPGADGRIIGKYGVDPDFVARFVDQMAAGQLGHLSSWCANPHPRRSSRRSASLGATSCARRCPRRRKRSSSRRSRKDRPRPSGHCKRA